MLDVEPVLTGRGLIGCCISLLNQELTRQLLLMYLPTVAVVAFINSFCGINAYNICVVAMIYTRNA